MHELLHDVVSVFGLSLELLLNHFILRKPNR